METIYYLLILGLLLLNYLAVTWFSHNQVMPWEGDTTEGFEGDKAKSMAEDTEVKWIEPPELFDSFYSQVYDQLTQGSVRLQA